MAAQGGVALQEKVRKLLNKVDKRPVLKPNRPLVLRDNVANRKLEKGEASCVTELSVLLACWKKNNFVDGLCSQEISSFHSCVKEAQAAKKSATLGRSGQKGNMNAKQVNTLLRRYPNLTTEI